MAGTGMSGSVKTYSMKMLVNAKMYELTGEQGSR
jgi:hypothetical protein